ncbi:tRNA pseudouridine(55) synthase TruB [Gloeothece verrucosa]|uniref:tRNA pseudouridine synthase B n=1 Tax=Gloeothece verrucosa (strain PCC 7822) TaxID=497965 RepID=E0UJZ0_GLOV7|nr:tRNA pseudouridine(55) synthase TruB [Gloeothece verrucosa]ADN14626.1 tRNA pseudouridine synthase B [Gloeothece verrucosa PCC 7822]
MLGFLNLNKPAGWTSHDCVAKIRRLLKIKRVGHGGTLDPAATGVLPIAVGKATRLLPFLPDKKAYRARIRFGVITTTDDLQGEIIQTCPCSHLTLEEILLLLPQFIGTIEQIPPAYSAISVGGKRLYKLARQGEQVEVPTRRVEIDQIDNWVWYPGEYPELEIDISCGPGTYIRSLARDLGNLLAVGGTLAALTRTLSCGMNLVNSLSLQEIEALQNQGQLSVIPPQTALKHLLTITLSEQAAQRWCQGQAVNLSDQINLSSSDKVQVVQDEQKFLGIGEVKSVKNSSYAEPAIIPKVVLH